MTLYIVIELVVEGVLSLFECTKQNHFLSSVRLSAFVPAHLMFVHIFYLQLPDRSSLDIFTKFVTLICLDPTTNPTENGRRVRAKSKPLYVKNV